MENELNALSVIFTEFYYWVTVVMMFLIHVGFIHGVAGGSALAILIHLGPRLGRFRDDGTPRVIPAHNVWLVAIGMFLIFTGFWGFYAACNVPIINVASEGGSFFSATTIYLTPTTLSAITFNFLMSLAGGMIMGYWVSRGDAFWTFQGGLGGVITASAGNERTNSNKVTPCRQPEMSKAGKPVHSILGRFTHSWGASSS